LTKFGAMMHLAYPRPCQPMKFDVYFCPGFVGQFTLACTKRLGQKTWKHHMQIIWMELYKFAQDY